MNQRNTTASIDSLEPKKNGMRLWPGQRQKYLWQILQKCNGRVLDVEIHNSGIGFFAHLNVLIRLLLLAEDQGFQPKIKFTSPNYLDPGKGNDWLTYHLEWKTLPQKTARFSFAIRTSRDLRLARINSLTLTGTRDLLFRHLRIKQDILDQVDIYCRERNIGNHTLAIHYRGTDKCAEAHQSSYKDAALAAKQFLGQNPQLKNLFLASDEAAFIRFMKQSILHYPVHSMDDYKRSIDGSPVHTPLTKLARPGNFEIGRDAIRNSLIISKCSVVVKTPSLLSAWSAVFNPDIEVILLAEAFNHANWFPERLIAHQARRWDPTSQTLLPRRGHEKLLSSLL